MFSCSYCFDPIGDEVIWVTLRMTDRIAVQSPFCTTEHIEAFAFDDIPV